MHGFYAFLVINGKYYTLKKNPQNPGWCITTNSIGLHGNGSYIKKNDLPLVRLIIRALNNLYIHADFNKLRIHMYVL